MTKTERQPVETVDVSPGWFDKAWEEPETYWRALIYWRLGSSAGHWARLFLSKSDAEDSVAEDGDEVDSFETVTINAVLGYCRCSNRPGVRVMARDENGWFVLREVSV